MILYADDLIKHFDSCSVNEFEVSLNMDIFIQINDATVKLKNDQAGVKTVLQVYPKSI